MSTFKEYIKENKEPEENSINESGNKLAKAFMKEVMSKDTLEFKLTLKHHQTGKMKNETVKVDSGVYLDSVAGSNRMLSHSQVVDIMKGKKSSINEWQKYMLNESLKYAFDGGLSRLEGPLMDNLGKDKWEFRIMTIDLGKTQFYKYTDKK